MVITSCCVFATSCARQSVVQGQPRQRIAPPNHRGPDGTQGLPSRSNPSLYGQVPQTGGTRPNTIVKGSPEEEAGDKMGKCTFL
eukprot:2046192-Heterocapsa_arctica.AAC.1